MKFAQQVYNVKMGETVTVKATAAEGYDGVISYSAEPTTVATVNSSTGEVTPVEPGTVTITATAAATTTFEQSTATCTVEVAAADTPDTPTQPGDTTTTTPSTPANSTFLDASFASNDGGFTAENIQVPEGSTYVWAYKSNYSNWQASAYVSGSNKASEAWLVSPEFNLANATSATLSFAQAGNYFTGVKMSDFCTVGIREAGTTIWTSLTLADTNYPSGTNLSDYADASVEIPSSFFGKKVEIGFHYKSTTSTAGTWVIKNVLVKGTTEGGSGDTPSQPGTTEEATDLLTNEIVGIGNPDAFTTKTFTGASGAQYSITSRGTHGSIQLRANPDNNSGIVVTKSAGTVKKVIIKFNESTTVGNSVSIYGSNNAYTSAAGLYTTSAAPLATFAYTVEEPTFEFVFKDEYAFIGIRATDDKVVRLDEVAITWNEEGQGGTPTPGNGEYTFDFTNNEYGMTRYSSGSTYNPEPTTVKTDGCPVSITLVGKTRLWTTGLRFHKADTAYKNQTAFTVANPGGTIEKIIITAKSGSDLSCFSLSGTDGTYATEGTVGTWTGSAESVTFTTDIESGGKEIQTITVVYDGGQGGGTVPPADADTTVASIADFYERCTAAAPYPVVALGVPVAVAHQSGNYLWVTDGTDWLLIYGDVAKTYANGDTIPAGIQGAAQNRYGAFQMSSPVAATFKEGIAGEAIEPEALAIDEVPADQIHLFVKLENVALSGFDDKGNFKISADGDTINGYNQLRLEGLAAVADTTIIGFVGIYNTNIQIIPVDLDAVNDTTTTPSPELPANSTATFNFTDPSSLNPAYDLDPSKGTPDQTEGNYYYDVDAVTFTAGEISLSSQAAGNPTRLYYSKSGSNWGYRFYKNSTVTIAASEGNKILKVEFTTQTNNHATALANCTFSAGTLAENTLDFGEEGVSNVTITNPADGGATVGLSTLVVYYSGSTGVDAVVVADQDAPVEFYNLQGVRIAEPAAGNIYIRRQGNTVTKVIIR